ncbi:UNVERIFIED_CONTAM: hypothetical protein NCL1_36532 [Trichonephila clavipes]
MCYMWRHKNIWEERHSVHCLYTPLVSIANGVLKKVRRWAWHTLRERCRVKALASRFKGQDRSGISNSEIYLFPTTKYPLLEFHERWDLTAIRSAISLPEILILHRQHALYYSDTPPLRLPAYLRIFSFPIPRCTYCQLLAPLLLQAPILKRLAISRLKMRQGPNFCFPTSASWTATTARAYYGRPAIDDKVTGPPKIQFQILLLRSETDMGLDFGALELANSATEGNENS